MPLTTHNTTEFNRAAEQNTKRAIWTKWIAIMKTTERKCLLHKSTVCSSGGTDDLSHFRTSSSLFFYSSSFFKAKSVDKARRAVWRYIMEMCFPLPGCSRCFDECRRAVFAVKLLKCFTLHLHAGARGVTE